MEKASSLVLFGAASPSPKPHGWVLLGGGGEGLLSPGRQAEEPQGLGESSQGRLLDRRE